MRRVIPVGLLAGVAAALALAAPASANTDTATCLVNGQMKASPPVNRFPATTGTYTFSSGQGAPPEHFECAATDTATGQTGVADVNLLSTGNYNFDCVLGGSFTSTANSLGSPVTTVAGSSQPGADLGSAIPGMAFSVILFGQQGRFFWQPGSTITAATMPLNAEVQDLGDGVITMAPNFDANVPAGQCSTDFTVTGVITGKFSGL